MSSGNYGVSRGGFPSAGAVPERRGVDFSAGRTGTYSGAVISARDGVGGVGNRYASAAREMIAFGYRANSVAPTARYESEEGKGLDGSRGPIVRV